MEFRQEDVAKLVLGYLRDQKCDGAFKEFLENSSHLKNHLARHRKGKPTSTRINGYSLVDMLKEYATVYNIIQDHLETSQYYEEQRKIGLVDQVQYLLDSRRKSSPTASRTSTPLDSQIFTTPSSNVISKENAALLNINCEVNTTPVEALPGNDTASSDISKSFNNEKSNIESNEASGKEKSQEFCKEIFTQTFLENAELIEKLADNINKEVLSKTFSSSEDRSYTIGQDLDNNVIDTIIQTMTEDPIIVSSIEEIIVNNQEEQEKINQSTGAHEIETVGVSSVLQQSTPNCSYSKKTPYTSEINKMQTRSSRKLVVPEITSSCSANLVSTNQSLSIVPPAEFTAADKANVILQSETAALTNQVYVNPVNSGLLMLQPNVSPAVTTLSKTVDSSKFYMIGNQPSVSNVIVQQSPFKMVNPLTEQDIMSMPTFIMCENPMTSQPVILSTVSTSVPTQSNFRTIAPKLTETAPSIQTLSEYISRYQCNDPSSPKIARSTLETSPAHVKTRAAASARKRLTKKITKNLENVSAADKKSTDNDLQETAKDSVQAENKETADSTPLAATPKTKIQQVQEKHSRSTPRNASHVRQLDFSTPEKWYPIVRQSNTSPKSRKPVEMKETPVKTNKFIKRTSLQFKSPKLELEAGANIKKETPTEDINLKTAAETPQSKSVKASTYSWDADLRALLQPTVKEDEVDCKRKRSDEFISEIPTKKAKANCDSTNTGSKLMSKSSSAKKNLSKSPLKQKSKSPGKKAGSTTRGNTSKKQAKETEISVNIADSNLQVTKIGTNQGVNRVSEEMDISCKSRIKKKCNLENSTKKKQAEEIVLTNITKIKSCEIVDESENNLVLSPTKLNANKRTLIEAENKNLNEGNVKTVNKDNEKLPGSNEDVTDSKFISPEIRTSVVKQSVVPVHETPVKFDSITGFPKTPSFEAPYIDTPFTKSVLDQLTEVDLSTIPTPQFPITPNIPFTPAIQSPFSNRGTDYSTSSSYYQPSDTEQNKSLEQLVEESRKYEKQQTATSESKESEDQTSSKLPKPTESPVQVENKTISDKVKAFNNSIIGKKNLHLVKMTSNVKGNECSSSSENSSDSDDSDSSSSSSNYEAISSPEKVTNTYSLRSRKSATALPPDDNATPKSLQSVPTIATVQEEQNSTMTKTSPQDQKSKKTFQDKLIEEMEKKRQRTIAKFKDASVTSNEKSKTPPAKDTLKKNPLGKKKLVSARKTPLKSKETKSIIKEVIKSKETKSIIKEVKTKLAKATVFPDKEIILHLSSDDDNTESARMVEVMLIGNSGSSTDNNTKSTNMKSAAEENINKETDDTTAKLIGLRQMGIHLIPNASKKAINQEDSKFHLKSTSEVPASSNQQLKDSKKQFVGVKTNLEKRSKSLFNTVVGPSGSQIRNNRNSKQTVKYKTDVKNQTNKTNDKSESNNKEKVKTTSRKDKKVDKVNVTDKKVNNDMKNNHAGLVEEGATEIPQVKSVKDASSATTKSTLCSKTPDTEDLQQSKSFEEKPKKIKTEKTNNFVTEVTSIESTSLLDDEKNEEKEEKFVASAGKIEFSGEPQKEESVLDISLEEGEVLSEEEQPLNLNIGKEDFQVKRRCSDSYQDYNRSNFLLHNKNEKFRYKHPQWLREKQRRSIYSKKDACKNSAERFKYEKFGHKIRNKWKPETHLTSSEDTSKVYKKNEASNKALKTKLINTSNEKIEKPSKLGENSKKCPETKKLTQNNGNNLSIVNENQGHCSLFDNQAKCEDIPFEVRIYEEETYKISHNYSKKINRTMSYYDLDILEKKFSANVYIAEIDAEVEKCLSFSPFELILDIPSAQQTRQASEKTKEKPLQILFNQLVKPAIDSSTTQSENSSRTSLLEDLYAPESRSYNRNSAGKAKTVAESEKTVKPRSGGSKSPIRRKLSSKSEHSNSEKYLKNCAKLGDDSKKIPKAEAKALEIVNGVVMLNSSDETETEVNDELMNYAIVGSERVESENGVLVPPPEKNDNKDNFRKRRLSEKSEEKQQEKKPKAEELLKTIDVDSFLKQLHGET